MIKKLLSIFAVAAMALSASANVDMLDSFGTSGWNSSYDAETKTITYDGAWTGRGWWLDGKDYSDYESIVIKFAEPLGGYVQIVCEYGTGDNGSAGANEGATEVEYTFDNDLKSNVKQIYLQCGDVVRSVVLAEAYLTEPDGSSEKVLFEGEQNLDWYPGFEIDKTKIIAAGAGSKLVSVVDFSASGEETYSIKLGISWTGKVLPSFKLLDNFQEEYNTIYTSDPTWSYTFTDDDIAALKSDGDGMLRFCSQETTVLKKLTLVNADAASVNAIEAADNNAPVEYFNLQGVRVANPENGLFIRRQGSKATKVLVK